MSKRTHRCPPTSASRSTGHRDGPYDVSWHLDAPFHVDGRGHAALTDDDDHVRDLIRAVLFTEPGERVNLPEFGCALKTLLFMPNHDVLGPAVRTLVQDRCSAGSSG